MKNAGIQFAYCKVSDGVGDFDATYPTNINGARAAGILVGPYHFAYPQSDKTNPLDAANEANYFVDLIQPFYQGNELMLRPVLDLESVSGQATTAAEKVFLSNWVRNFATVVENRMGVKPIVYANGNFAQTYYETNINQYPLWFAKPTTNIVNDFANAVPPTTANLGIWGSVGWKFWQWSWTGNVGGTSPLDRNVFNGTLLELAQQFSPNYSNGDYNNNGLVDAADYALWRNTLGQSVKPGMGADGDLSGMVDEGDFAIWKTNLGKAVTGAGSSTAVGAAIVPEPSAFLLMIIAVGSLAAHRRRARTS